MGGVWVFFQGSGQLMFRVAEIDEKLRRVAAISQDLGFKTTIDEDQNLSIIVPLDDHYYPVSAEIISSDVRPSFDLVRFQCSLNEAASNGRRQTKLNLKKEQLVTLLQANISNASSSHFAIDENQTSVSSVAYQPVSTMDDQEIRWHLESVAKESERGRSILGLSDK